MVVNKSVPFLLFVVVYLIWEVISEAKNGRLVPIGYASCVFFSGFFVVGISVIYSWRRLHISSWVIGRLRLALSMPL